MASPPPAFVSGGGSFERTNNAMEAIATALNTMISSRAETASARAAGHLVVERESVSKARQELESAEKFFLDLNDKCSATENPAVKAVLEKRVQAAVERMTVAEDEYKSALSELEEAKNRSIS